jgi:predicted  nucleic acid-binding Zn-ribbon protein
MEFDTEDIEQKLKEIDISRKRNTMDVENINSRIEKARRYISDLESEVYKADSVSDYDIKTAESDIKSNEFEITQTKSEVARLEKDYEDLKTLFNAGAASQSELDAAERNIQASRDKMTTLETKRETRNERLENTRKNISDTRSKNSDAVAKQETARTKQLADYQADLASYDQELKGKELDKLNLDLQEAAQRRALEKCENGRAIYAKEDATIISLPISAGQKANEGQLVASCGVTGRFEVLCKVSLENNFIAVGDSCYLQNTSMYVQGKVTKINSTEQVKEITVLLEANSDDGSEGSAAPAPSPRGMGRFRGFGRQVFGDVNDIKAGETFDVTFEKESTVSYTLIPNGTLNMDSQGYFLYRVARRDGILGKEFYVEKLRVNIGDSDSDNTAITSGIMFFEPIVSLSDKGFSEGDVVQLSNEGDFFAN